MTGSESSDDVDDNNLQLTFDHFQKLLEEYITPEKIKTPTEIFEEYWQNKLP